MLPSLKSCDRKILRALVDKINEAVSLIPKANVTETNDLLCATAYITAEMLGKIPMKKTARKQKESFRERNKNNTAAWWRDLSKIEEVAKGRMKIGQRDQWRRDQKHKLRERGTLYVRGMLSKR